MHEAEEGIPALAPVDRRPVRRGGSRGPTKDMERSQKGGRKPALVTKGKGLPTGDDTVWPPRLPSEVGCKLSSANQLWGRGLLREFRPRPLDF